MRQTYCSANLNIITRKISCRMKYYKHPSTESILSVINAGKFFFPLDWETNE